MNNENKKAEGSIRINEEPVFTPFAPQKYLDDLLRIATGPVIVSDNKRRKYEIKQIYTNVKKGATTVLWGDGTHTTVKVHDDGIRYQPFDIYYAVCAALAKKVYGSNTHFKKIIEEKTVSQTKKGKKK